MLFNLTEHNSIANQFLKEVRSHEIQKDRMRFRKNMERLGEIMAYEVSKKLIYTVEKIETVLGTAAVSVPENPVLITILRAGIPFFQGLLNFFDQATCGFIGALRKEHGQEVTISLDYVSLPPVENKTIILIDPMLATGKSIAHTIEAIVKNGTPLHIHIVSMIAAPEGISYLANILKIPYSLWTCAVDEKLNAQFYIVPGLGDAGDLSFGNKI